MGSKKTDYSCRIDGVGVVAVSVTRALKHRGTFTRQDAYELLYKKLRCVQGSNQNVCSQHKWERQLLHVWTVRLSQHKRTRADRHLRPILRSRRLSLNASARSRSRPLTQSCASLFSCSSPS